MRNVKSKAERVKIAHKIWATRKANAAEGARVERKKEKAKKAKKVTKKKAEKEAA